MVKVAMAMESQFKLSFKCLPPDFNDLRARTLENIYTIEKSN